MNVRLGTISIVILFSTAACQAGQQHHRAQDNSQKVANRTSPNNFSYLGSTHSTYISGYQLVVNLNEIDSMPRYKSSIEIGRKMTPEQTELVWSRLTDDLPVNTDFKIVEAKFSDNNVGYIVVRLEESASTIEMPTSNFIVNSTIEIPTGSFYDADEAPTLQAYVDLNKWTKQTGYQASIDHLSNSNRPVMKATIVFNQLHNNGEVDVVAYNEIFKKIDIPISLDQMIVLTDGTRAIEKLVTPKRLEVLYQEPNVINIIPNPNL